MKQQNDALAKLRGIKHREERSAAQALRAAQDRLTEAAEQLETLRGYVAEYRRLAPSGGVLQRLRDARSFLANLERCLDAQRAAVEREQANVESVRARWRDVHVQRESMDKLAERRAEASARERLRVEQRQADEHAARGGRKT